MAHSCCHVLGWCSPNWRLGVRVQNCSHHQSVGATRSIGISGENWYLGTFRTFHVFTEPYVCDHVTNKVLLLLGSIPKLFYKNMIEETLDVYASAWYLETHKHKMLCLSGKFGSNALSSSSNYRGDTGCWLLVGRRRIAAMLLLDSIDTEPGPMFCRARRRAASGL